jgi:hypothetical protein
MVLLTVGSVKIPETVMEVVTNGDLQAPACPAVSYQVFACLHFLPGVFTSHLHRHQLLGLGFFLQGLPLSPTPKTPPHYNVLSDHSVWALRRNLSGLGKPAGSTSLDIIEEYSSSRHINAVFSVKLVGFVCTRSTSLVAGSSFQNAFEED